MILLKLNIEVEKMLSRYLLTNRFFKNAHSGKYFLLIHLSSFCSVHVAQTVEHDACNTRVTGLIPMKCMNWYNLEYYVCRFG